LLLATGDKELVEVSHAQNQVLFLYAHKLVKASPFDKIWGIGFTEKGAEKNRHKWGQNLLGKALMKVRDRLRDQEKAAGEKIPLEEA